MRFMIELEESEKAELRAMLVDRDKAMEAMRAWDSVVAVIVSTRRLSPEEEAYDRTVSDAPHDVESAIWDWFKAKLPKHPVLQRLESWEDALDSGDWIERFADSMLASSPVLPKQLPVAANRPNEYVDTKEAARILGLAEVTLRKWRVATTETGSLVGPSFSRFGGAVRYSRRAFSEFAAAAAVPVKGLDVSGAFIEGMRSALDICETVIADCYPLDEEHAPASDGIRRLCETARGCVESAITAVLAGPTVTDAGPL